MEDVDTELGQELVFGQAELVCPADFCLGWSADLGVTPNESEEEEEQVAAAEKLSCGEPPHFCLALHTGRLCAECVEGAYKMPTGRCCTPGSWWAAVATAAICVVVGAVISLAALPSTDLDVEPEPETEPQPEPEPEAERSTVGQPRRSSLRVDLAAACCTLGFYFQVLQLMNFPSKSSKWW